MMVMVMVLVGGDGYGDGDGDDDWFLSSKVTDTLKSKSIPTIFNTDQN